MRIARIVGVRVHRCGRCIDVNHDNEGLSAGYVGVYPVRLGHQVGGWAQRGPPTSGVRLVHQVETEHFRIANEGCTALMNDESAPSHSPSQTSPLTPLVRESSCLTLLTAAR